MYTEGFDELSEAENRPQHHYVSGLTHPDTAKLLRETERLKKSLEKEQFFNRLLDQELKELKSSPSEPVYDPNIFERKTGVSKGAFNALLLLTIAMGAFILYTLYYNKQYNLFESANSTAPAASVPLAPMRNDARPPATNLEVIPENKAVTNGEEHTSTHAGKSITDSVPNIIANKTLSTDTKIAKKLQAAPLPQSATETGTNVKDPERTTKEITPATTSATDTRPVIAYYKVTSKANFYTDPNETSMRSTFIAQSDDKKIGALDEKNGFIYVIYTNDLGYVSKGWLSKKDLTLVK